MKTEIKAPKNKIITLDGGPKNGAVLLARPDGAMCLAVKIGDNIITRLPGDLTVPANGRAATYAEVGDAFVSGHQPNDQNLTAEQLAERFVNAHDGPRPVDSDPVDAAEPVTP